MTDDRHHTDASGDVWVRLDDIKGGLHMRDHQQVVRSGLRPGQEVVLSERDLHISVVKYVRARHPNTLIISGVDSALQSHRTRGLAVKLGYQKGTPDILVFFYDSDARLALELKSPTGEGRVTEELKKVLQALHVSGFHAAVASTLLEAIAAVEECAAVPRRGRGGQRRHPPPVF